MEREYWLELWQNDEIRFHQHKVNPVLQELWPKLNVSPEKGVLVPLCGKSLDMRWLEQQGHQVWGVELAEKAITAYFEEAGETPVYETGINIDRYRGSRTVIYHGDYLQLQTPDLRGVGAVFEPSSCCSPSSMTRANIPDRHSALRKLK
jgi:thiopurine S-methyltransferase